MEESGDFRSLVARLNHIGAALSSEHNLGKLLEMIVSELRAFTRSDGGSLYIKRGDELSFEVAQNDTLLTRLGNVPFKSFTIPIDHRSLAGYVALTGRLLNIPDIDRVGDDVPFSLDTMREFDRSNRLKTVSMLAVPMRNYKDEIIGVVQLFNSLDGDGKPVPYKPWVEELVTSIASQAAVAISNSVLISDIKRLFESITAYSVQAIDARSPHTAGHSKRVSKLVMEQSEAINRVQTGPFAHTCFSEDELNEIHLASWLHDIGKIGVREYVLDKVNKLSDSQINAIFTRFNYLKVDCRNRANERKIELLRSGSYTPEAAVEIDSEVGRELENLDSDSSFILRINRPGCCSNDDLDRLKAIAGKTYLDPDGEKHTFLESYEMEHLHVRKGNLTESERSEIQSHVRHTLAILEKIPFTEELRNIPRFAAAHHEMLDGSGYPNGLQGEEIPLQSRIITVADIFDALTARDRPYKPPLPVETALRILREEAGAGRLDPDLVDLFITEGIYNSLQSS